MKGVNYFMIVLSCILDFFATAYRPLISKKACKKQNMIRVLSGLIGSVITTKKEIGLLQIVSSTFIRGPEREETKIITPLFDPNMFLNWWFSGSKQSSSQSSLLRKLPVPVILKTAQIEKISMASTIIPNMPLNIISNNVNTTLSTANKVQQHDLPVGYMDFEPMEQAILQHTHIENKKWFKRS